MWTTGMVGPIPRAVMHNGQVIAVAEDAVTATGIARALNGEDARRITARQLVLLRDAVEELLRNPDLGAAHLPLRDLLRVGQEEQPRQRVQVQILSLEGLFPPWVGIADVGGETIDGPNSTRVRLEWV